MRKDQIAFSTMVGPRALNESTIVREQVVPVAATRPRRRLERESMLVV